jgi:hypothetical protein
MTGIIPRILRRYNLDTRLRGEAFHKIGVRFDTSLTFNMLLSKA